ncbi:MULTISPECIES: hypothetical protein [Paenibacillus]|jgi:peptidoglycan hydrolase CwlO-like protein|uniref:Uncharacterized protein n=2 Tax=Paenibacillus barengoltzii TaxID=343517 RepID=R9LJF4_9BACL|nr:MULTISPECIES: hypothetical protein [Paenibacillus]EOS55877.1 hypothetical protein C812_02457 [Paenibacillus barengoltzii G22]MDU0330035.1 hypothetical protein [Paenibacillus sp. 3LSP]SMF30653.1 hypothetical protein SAMN02744102_02540 [Paenibacillus barengoltzii]SMF37569.1 hypothetical protein SAMN02744124_02680 [Paenibacillus barengoltzii J12]
MPYSTESATVTETSRSRRTRRPSVALIILIWILLIGAGVTAAYMYSNHLKQSMIDQLDAKWQSEAELMKADYTAQLTALSEEVQELQNKVQAFNELLEFTKDNTSEKTDNSNKLFSQLSEVKEQLAALQKKMDLLK